LVEEENDESRGYGSLGDVNKLLQTQRKKTAAYIRMTL